LPPLSRRTRRPPVPTGHDNVGCAKARDGRIPRARDAGEMLSPKIAGLCVGATIGIHAVPGSARGVAMTWSQQ
jgi:hypothetical protein